MGWSKKIITNLIIIFLTIFYTFKISVAETQIPICEEGYTLSFKASAKIDDKPNCIKIPDKKINIGWIFGKDTKLKIFSENSDFKNGHFNMYNLFALDFLYISGSKNVYAADSGTIHISNNCNERNIFNGNNKKSMLFLHGLGTNVKIIHDNGIGTVYAHLESYSATDGAKVKKGDLIGKISEHHPFHFSVHEIVNTELFKLNSVVSYGYCHDHTIATETLVLAPSLPFVMHSTNHGSINSYELIKDQIIYRR